MCQSLRLGRARTAALARKMPRIAQKEIIDIVALEPEALKVMRLNMSPSRAPARSPLSTAQVNRTPEPRSATLRAGIASLARLRVGVWGEGSGGATSGAPPVAVKKAPSRKLSPAIHHNVRS
jgi:hypothetical protein